MFFYIQINHVSLTGEFNLIAKLSSPLSGITLLEIPEGLRGRIEVNMTEGTQLTRSKRTMSVSHKRAIAISKKEASAVRTYLTLLSASKKSPGLRSKDVIVRKLNAVKDSLKESNDNVILKLKLTQELKNLEKALRESEKRIDEKAMRAAERAFIRYGKAYADRHGIDKSTWRAFGVSAKILAEAGIN